MNATHAITAAWHGLRARVHVRHWRGRGIHSPFMYGVVRNVFMPRKVTGGDRALFDALTLNGVGRRQATILQNLFAHCGMDGYNLWTTHALRIEKRRNLCVVLADDAAEAAAARAATGCGIVALVGPRRRSALKRAGERIRQKYPCVSVDRIDMLLFFFDPKLQPQHYRI